MVGMLVLGSKYRRRPPAMPRALALKARAREAADST